MIEKLSNYIIKAYKKRDGCISFHFKSHLLIKTNTSFSVSEYFKLVDAYFILPDYRKIEFQQFGFYISPTIVFNGEFIVIEAHFSTVSTLTKIKTCLVDLVIVYSFFGHPCLDPDEFKSKALVKWMY